MWSTHTVMGRSNEHLMHATRGRRCSAAPARCRAAAAGRCSAEKAPTQPPSRAVYSVSLWIVCVCECVCVCVCVCVCACVCGVHIMHATRGKVQVMPRRTCTRPRALQGVPPAAERRKPRCQTGQKSYANPRFCVPNALILPRAMKQLPVPRDQKGG